MKLRFDKRAVLLYALVILVLLAIQFIEPYPKGTEDYETYNFAQWFVYPPIAAFVMTVVFCVAAKGKAEEKLPIIIGNMLIGVLGYIVSMSEIPWGIDDMFLCSILFYGFPSAVAVLLYIIGRALFEILDESSEEAMRKWEENNTSGF